MSSRSGTSRAERALREFGLSFPGTTEEFPWGHRTLKVNKKVFVLMGSDENGFGISVKLPESGAAALSLPFTQPTGYGLGKAGWVDARFGPKDDIPLELLKAWIRESYRAIAPKKLVAQLDAAAAGSSGAATATSARASAPARVKKKAAGTASRTRTRR